ncbi:MBL fold metallo-hydrolase [Lacticaseibacillus rhamnosus]
MGPSANRHAIPGHSVGPTTTETKSILGVVGIDIGLLLDTHPHADHFSAAHYLQERTGAPTPGPSCGPRTRRSPRSARPRSPSGRGVS